MENFREYVSRPSEYISNSFSNPTDCKPSNAIDQLNETTEQYLDKSPKQRNNFKLNIGYLVALDQDQELTRLKIDPDNPYFASVLMQHKKTKILTHGYLLNELSHNLADVNIYYSKRPFKLNWFKENLPMIGHFSISFAPRTFLGVFRDKEDCELCLIQIKIRGGPQGTHPEAVTMEIDKFPLFSGVEQEAVELHHFMDVRERESGKSSRELEVVIFNKGAIYHYRIPHAKIQEGFDKKEEHLKIAPRKGFPKIEGGIACGINFLDLNKTDGTIDLLVAVRSSKPMDQDMITIWKIEAKAKGDSQTKRELEVVKEKVACRVNQSFSGQFCGMISLKSESHLILLCKSTNKHPLPKNNIMANLVCSCKRNLIEPLEPVMVQYVIISKEVNYNLERIMKLFIPDCSAHETPISGMVFTSNLLERPSVNNFFCDCDPSLPSFVNSIEF